MGSRHRVNLAQTQLIELGELHAFQHAFGFVGNKYTRFTKAAQIIGDVMVLRRYTCARIHHKNDHISFGNGLLRLLGHFLVNSARCIRLKTASIDNDVLVLALLAIAVMPVTRKPCKVRNNGVAGLGQAVEERGLADIRTPHEGDNWLH
ncbi:hypothetical protein D3C71_1222630 [compost metagenome]